MISTKIVSIGQTAVISSEKAIRPPLAGGSVRSAAVPAGIRSDAAPYLALDLAPEETSVQT